MGDNIFGRPITVEQRSRIMSKIRGRGSKLERTVASWLDAAAIPYAEQAKVVGKPDFFIGELNCAIFVDSAFWHGHTLPMIKERLTPYWSEKIKKNVSRDKVVNRQLKIEGLKVIRLMEDDIVKDPEVTRKRLIGKLKRLKKKLESEVQD